MYSQLHMKGILMKNLKLYLTLLVGALIMGCCGGNCGCSGPQDNGTEVSFYQGDEVKENDIIMIQYSAEWCGPCRRLKQELKNSDEFKKFLEDSKIKYFVIDTDTQDPKEKKWVESAQPRSIPLVVAYTRKDGKWVKVSEFVGYKSPAAVADWLSGVQKELLK